MMKVFWCFVEKVEQIDKNWQKMFDEKSGYGDVFFFGKLEYVEIKQCYVGYDCGNQWLVSDEKSYFLVCVKYKGEEVGVY